METNNVTRGEAYYKLVGEKNVERIKKYLPSDVEFSGPLANLKGREAVIKATSHFMNLFKSLTIRAKFGSGDQAMIIYDSDIPGIAKNFPGASLLTFRVPPPFFWTQICVKFVTPFASSPRAT